MAAPEDRVTVRMYREILGDCFLVTVAEKGVRKHILIDCGVLQSVVSGDAMMAKLPPEVTGAIGEERVRKVRSGGDQIRKIAKDVWNDADLKIAKLWLAWTEDPADDQAKALYARFAKARQALAYAATLA